MCFASFRVDSLVTRIVVVALPSIDLYSAIQQLSIYKLKRQLSCQGQSFALPALELLKGAA
jgi:hypothetical protein